MADGPSPETTQTTFTHPVRVTWADCDPALIAYTARLPYFALDAIDAWWSAHHGAGWYEMNMDENIGTPFVHLSMDFTSPVTPRHTLMCDVWPNKLGETSVGFHVTARQDGKLCFEGNFVCVFVRADKFVKTAPPPSLRDLVEAHLRPAD